MPSSATEQLEAALAASFDHATLAVYADHLQAEGDVRGELIAIDLEIVQRGTSATLLARRSELLHAWLGRLVALDVADSFRFGFLQRVELTAERLALVLAHPAGRYMRGLVLHGDHERALPMLATARHGWLSTLVLSPDRGRPADVAADRLIAATPVLTRLELQGKRVLGELPHPHVRELAITGTRAFAGIYGDGPPLPSVCLLDIAFDRAYIAQEPVVDRHVLLSELRLPALRTLDLSRNEPSAITGASFTIDGHSLWSYLGNLELRRQLTHLLLPALRSDDDTAELTGVLASMPALERVELARGPGYEVPPLFHAHATFTIGMPWPWPTRVPAGARLRVTIPGAREPELADLHVALAVMPEMWAALPDDARVAWRTVWGALGASIALDTLLLAIESCGERLDEGGWRELREALIDHRVPGARVTLQI